MFRSARCTARITSLAAVLLAAGVALRPLSAQVGGSLAGRVVSSVTGHPLGGALVSVVSTPDTTLTGRDGLFRFDRLAYGQHVLHVEYLGMHSRDIPVRITPRQAASISLSLEMKVIPMAELVVQVRRELPVSKLYGFYRRMAHDQGVFITRQDIVKRHPSEPSDLLRQVPGVHVGPTQYGSATVTMGRRRGCVPDMWVDGTRAPHYNIDNLQPNDLAGIEIYRGNSEVPAEFKWGERCGVIVIWTRDPGSWR